METFEELLNYIKNNPLSIELLNKCRIYFLLHNEKEEKQIFIEELLEKVREVFSENEEYITLALARAILYGGFETIEEIVLIDDAIFVEMIDKHKRQYSKYIGSKTGTLKAFDCYKMIGAFTKLCDEKEKGEKFSQEFSDIYNKFYANERKIKILPEQIKRDDGFYVCYMTTFAINNGQIEKNIALAYQNEEKENFKIVDQSRKDKEYKVIEIEVNPKDEKSLKVISVDNYSIKLSDILNKKEKEDTDTFYK